MLRRADALARGAHRVAAVAVAALILLMLLEVALRYGAGRPTLWSHDLVGMLSGVVFVFAAGHALADGSHVAVDVLSRRFDPRIAAAIRFTFYVLIFAPILVWLVWIGATRTHHAWLNGAVDDVSPWRRPLWPFYAAMTIGLTSFLVAIVAASLRMFEQIRRRG
jgi:TRAP-type C4-dicarboxylate transport system permease small subunit